MMITNTLVTCCEVVIVRLLINGPSGSVHLMILWESIPMKENVYKVTPYGLGTIQSTTYVSGSYALYGEL
jgi:hypothetical protein